MKTIHKFLPEFLKKIDKDLLLKKPVIWETRVHIMGFVLGIYFFVALVLCMLPSISGALNLGVSLFSGPMSFLLGIVSTLLLGFWVYSQFKYGVENQFGSFSIADARKRLACYAFIMLGLGFPVIMPYIITDWRIANFVDDATFEEDVAHLNKTQIYFPIESNKELNIFDLMQEDTEGFYLNQHFFPTLSSSENRERFDVTSMNNERFLGLHKEALENPNAIQDIERYLSLYEKYLNSKPELYHAQSAVFEGEDEIAASKVLEAFRKGDASYDIELVSHLKSSLSMIESAKTGGWHLIFSQPIPLFIFLLAFVILTNLAIVARYIGAKYFMFGLGISIFLMMFLGISVGMLMGIVGIAVAIILILLSVSVLKLKTGQGGGFTGSKSSLFWLGIGQLSFFPSIFGLTMLPTGMLLGGDLNWDTNTVFLVLIMELLAISLIFVQWIFPKFHSTYLRIKARPVV